MQYTKIPSTAFKSIQLNAGILVDEFTPATGAIGNIIGATTGGITFSTSPSFTDFGEDIDNCVKNTKELKRLDTIDAKMSGTFVTVSAGLAKVLVAAGDIDEADQTHIIPRNDLTAADFKDMWWVGDYSDINTTDESVGASAGYVAIKLTNALSTGGFQIQSSDKAKGQFAFEFTGHYSIEAPDTVPYEIYIVEGSGTVKPTINIDKHSLTVADGDTATITATATPDTASITWTSEDNSVATVSGGVVTAAGAGNTIITASITVDGVTYNDTCTVIVTD